MKVLFLFNRVQKDSIAAVKAGRANDDHLYGLLRLPAAGIEADYLEIEQIWPRGLCKFLRKYVLNVYWAHLPFFFRFRKYDVIFTSTAFGCQFLHTLYPFNKPKWVMLDFSITGLIGERRTLRQKLFYWVVSWVAGIITIDKDEETKLKALFPDKAKAITFLSAALDTNFSRPLTGIDQENIIFSPGRDPGRDFRTLFEAARDLKQRVVLTTRPWTLKKLLPLPNFVEHGDFSQKEYNRAYAKARLVVIPLDIRGGFNNAMGCSTLVEAMAMGKAVIITRTPTTESYVTDGVNGLLVPPRNSAALRAAIQRIVADPDLAATLGRNAREFAVTHCSDEQYIPRLAEYFRKIVI